MVTMFHKRGSQRRRQAPSLIGFEYFDADADVGTGGIFAGTPARDGSLMQPDKPKPLTQKPLYRRPAEKDLFEQLGQIRNHLPGQQRFVNSLNREAVWYGPCRRGQTSEREAGALPLA